MANFTTTGSDTFPAGMVIQVFSVGPLDDTQVGTSASTVKIDCTNVTSGSKMLVTAHGQLMHDTGSSGTNHSGWYLTGNGSSGIGATTSGHLFRQEFGRIHAVTTDWYFWEASISVLSTACTTASPTYTIYNTLVNPGGQTVYMENWFMTAQEISQ